MDMLRPIVRRELAWPAIEKGDEIDLPAVAKVSVSSEKSLYPIDNVFDAQRWPGGSCWVASESGEQTVIVSFDSPRTLRAVAIELEERGGTRTQEVAVETSADHGVTYQPVASETFELAPYGTSFAAKTFSFSREAVTHVKLRVRPEGGLAGGLGTDSRASLTSVVFR
jgi:hypothetical protein